MGFTIEGFWKNYKKYVKQSGLKYKANTWVMFAVLAAIIILIIGLMMNITLGPGFDFYMNCSGEVKGIKVYETIPTCNFNPNYLKMPLLLFIVILDLMLGYPYLLYSRRINKIEDAFPDSLKQMADTLRAGGTYEFAIREIAISEYGPLSEEMEKVLRGLEEGLNFEQALGSFSDDIDSILVKRTVTIIVDAVKAGAGLSDVLDQVSDDMRDLHRITLERKSKTMMQVLFMVMAGAIVAPAIFGMVSQIINFLISAATKSGVAAKEVIFAAVAEKNTILTLLEIYVLIEIIASSVMISLMREGKASKSIIYIPILLLIAFAIYLAAGFAVGGMVKGLG